MTFPARDGDVYLLCSDGLTTMVSDDEIRRILAESKSLRSAVNKLVEAANRGGGRDNITAVAFRVADADAKEGEESATLISRTAEQAGLTGEKVRAATDRIRGRGPMPAPRRRRRILGWAARHPRRDRGVRRRRSWWLGRSTSSAPTTRGEVALYRGLPYALPLGISLYSKQYSVPIQEGTLSEERQRAVTGHTLRGKGDATDLINDIKSRPTEGLPPPPAPPPAKKKSEPATRASRPRRVERPHPRALRPDPGRAPGHGRVHGRADHELGQARQPEPVLRRLLPGPLRRHPHLHPDPAARRGSVPVPAGARCSPRSAW